MSVYYKPKGLFNKLCWRESYNGCVTGLRPWAWQATFNLELNREFLPVRFLPNRFEAAPLPPEVFTQAGRRYEC